MKMSVLLKNKEALELIKKIINETALGNSVAFALATLAKNSLSLSVFNVLLCPVLTVSAILVMLWMFSLVTIYFSELETLIGKRGTFFMVMWALVCELFLVVSLVNLIPDFN
ncbi:hypothetical protein C7431_11186 [Pantoea allii]|uniref:Uncharacterized protein n=1 Tax=Pantoea allii TaxID=574096 RepID=A0A2V2BD09_9GAMM|nr:hypothetical protein [Pantoea allii]PWK94349.1 hypothetical protein C7431_11186 [Pantoea allii]